MSTVAEIAVQYAAKGSKAAIRADRSVRDSIQTTAKTAQSEAGTIDRWMERHQSAIQAIGVATVATMGAILSASPTMRAELSGVRMAFSLFADTVVNDVLPEGTSLVDMAFDLEEAYRELPDPIRNATSHLLIFGGILGGLALAAAGAQKILAGTFVAKGLALVASAATTAAGGIFGIVAGSAALMVALGIVIGIIGVWIADALGLIDVARRMGSWLGDRLPDSVVDGFLVMLSATMGVLLVLGAAILGFVDDGIGGAVRETRKMLGLFADSWRRTGSRVKSILIGVGSWIRSFFSSLGSDAVSWGRDIGSGFGNSFRNAFNDVIPSSVSLPEVDLGPAGTYGGGSLSLPRLRHGGDVERGGLARLHAGERVVPAAEVSSSGGTGGGTTIITVEQHIESGGSPRRTADKSAEAVSQTIQDEFATRR